MLNQSAESFLINTQNKDIIYKNIFIEIPHGRLNHWIFVFRTLFILFRKIGIKAHLYYIGENILSRELRKIMNNSLSKKSILYPNYPLFISNKEDFFSSQLEPLIESIEKKEFEEFQKEFLICFQPIIELLTKKETINKLSKKLKIDLSTFLSRKKISIHLRRGDLAVLEKKKYLDSPIGVFFESDCFICKYGFLSNSEFLLAKIEDKPIIQPARRFHKQKPINYYTKLINKKIKEGYLVFLFSDGFTRIANQFKQKTKCNYSPKEIETLIEKIEFPFEKDPNLIVSYGENIMGCSGRRDFLLNLILSFRDKIRGTNYLFNYNELLCIAYNADFLIAKESDFPASFIENLKPL